MKITPEISALVEKIDISFISSYGGNYVRHYTQNEL